MASVLPAEAWFSLVSGEFGAESRNFVKGGGGGEGAAHKKENLTIVSAQNFKKWVSSEVLNHGLLVWFQLLLSCRSSWLRGYHFDRLPSLSGLTPGPLIFPSKSPPRGHLFSAKLRPRVEKTKQSLHSRHNLPSSNDKISMNREHKSIRAISF